MFRYLKFSVRQLLALTLIVGLSLQAWIQAERIAFLRAEYRVKQSTYAELESRMRAMKHRTRIQQIVIHDWPSSFSQEYTAAKERSEGLRMENEDPDDR